MFTVIAVLILAVLLLVGHATHLAEAVWLIGCAVAAAFALVDLVRPYWRA